MTLESVKKTGSVILANISGLGISMANVESGLKILSLVLAIVYTGYRFWKDIQKNK